MRGGSHIPHWKAVSPAITTCLSLVRTCQVLNGESMGDVLWILDCQRRSSTRWLAVQATADLPPHSPACTSVHNSFQHKELMATMSHVSQMQYLWPSLRRKVALVSHVRVDINQLQPAEEMMLLRRRPCNNLEASMLLVLLNEICIQIQMPYSS